MHHWAIVLPIPSHPRHILVAPPHSNYSHSHFHSALKQKSIQYHSTAQYGFSSAKQQNGASKLPAASLSYHLAGLIIEIPHVKFIWILTGDRYFVLVSSLYGEESTRPSDQIPREAITRGTRGRVEDKRQEVLNWESSTCTERLHLGWMSWKS